MRDLFFIGFLGLLAGLAIRHPYVLGLAYVWVDLVQPHHITYYFFNSLPVSLIVAVSCLGAFFLFDDKKGIRISPLQVLIGLLAIWTSLTTLWAVSPYHAIPKWDWVWKTLVFSAFLPVLFRTRLQIEALLLFIIGSVVVLTGIAGIKSLLGGAGYGSLALLQRDANMHLSESSTLSLFAIATIPLAWFLRDNSQIIPYPFFRKIAAIGITVVNLATAYGSFARTAIVAGAVLVAFALKWTRHKLLLIIGLAVALSVGLAYTSEDWRERMGTIKTFESDGSAATRIAVWKWTLEFTAEHPLGGGFNSFVVNNLEIRLGDSQEPFGGSVMHDRARAFHNMYFEVLGEHGYPGLILYMSLLITALVQLRRLKKKYLNDPVPERQWIGKFAKALFATFCIFMIGGNFVGIAFQSIVFFCIVLVACLHNYARRLETAEVQQVETQRIQRSQYRLRPAE